MVVHTIRIDDRKFVLAGGQNIAKLKKRIRHAARTKAAFVAFTPLGRQPVSVLMTPNTSVLFEESHRADEQPDLPGHSGYESHGVHLDFDLGYGPLD